MGIGVMHLLAGLGDVGHSLWSHLIPYVFVLTVVVFFHEMGHFLVARFYGVKVNTFSIGFGREIAGWNDKYGTRWKISWIPLGGYVKFEGDESAASTPDRRRLEAVPESERIGLFHFKPLYQRAAVVAAGPFANFILAIILFAGLFTIVGKPFAEPIVDIVRPGSVAEQAGFQPGDRVASINGGAIDSFEDLQRVVSNSADMPLTFVLKRGGGDVTIVATPKKQEIKDAFGTHTLGLLGVERSAKDGNFRLVKSNPVESLWLGAKETWFVVSRTMGYIGEVVIGREDASQIGGPLRTAQLSGIVASFGFSALVNLIAVLSVSIGLLNLFPVPMLDGGHLLYYSVEAARGRPMGEQAQEFGFRIGLALVMLLMVFATWNDLVHLQVFSLIGGLFS
jgi:regulator of sigma E protease